MIVARLQKYCIITTCAFGGKGGSKTPSFVCSLKIEEVSTEQPTDVPEREELRDQEPAHPSNEVATEEPATSVSVNVHEC
jgi:hypothetical protein